MQILAKNAHASVCKPHRGTCHDVVYFLSYQAVPTMHKYQISVSETLPKYVETVGK